MVKKSSIILLLFALLVIFSGCGENTDIGNMEIIQNYAKAANSVRSLDDLEQQSEVIIRGKALEGLENIPMISLETLYQD